MLHSVGANAAHGLQRTNADKRRAVMTLLSDPEWSKWSNHEIARKCCVGHSFVNNMRNSLDTVSSDDDTRTFIDKHGNVTEMKTGKIGGK